MPLSLLALGADEVVAVDLEVNQLHLGELKRAAVCSLDREWRSASRSSAGDAQRTPALARLVTEEMSPAARLFWQEHGRAALEGPIWRVGTNGM